MADIVLQRNVGSLVTVRRATLSGTATAGTTGDATTVTGQTIDRAAIGMPLSAVFATLWEATLTNAKTLSIATTIQHSANDSDWTDYATEAATIVQTAGSSTAFKGQHGLNVDLSSAKRYVRMNWQPDLSHTGTDTSIAVGVAVFAGEDRLAAAV